MKTIHRTLRMPEGKEVKMLRRLVKWAGFRLEDHGAFSSPRWSGFYVIRRGRSAVYAKSVYGVEEVPATLWTLPPRRVAV